MIRFFKVNDPLRLIGLILVILIIRIPLMISDIPLSAPDLSWMLLGEKINEGQLMYKDIIDNTGPLMAYFVGLLYKAFGRSQLAFQIISLLLVLLQAIYFNLILNAYDVLKEKNYIPGFLYILWSSISLEFLSISPALLALTFVLFAFRHLFSILKKGSNDEHLFLLGLNIGLATLFYMPAIIFALLFIIIFVLYTNVSFRRYGVYFFGLFVPLIFIGLYFYWEDNLQLFLSDTLIYSLNSDSIKNVTFSQIALFLIPTALIMTVGALKAFSARGLVNFQQIVFVFAVTYSAFALLTLFIAFRISYSNTLFLLPTFTIFSYFLVTEFKKRWVKELVPTLLILTLAYLTFMFQFDLKGNTTIYNDKLLLTAPLQQTEGRVLILDTNNEIYLQHKQATGFFNWQLSKRYFKGMNDYEYVEIVYDNLKSDLPDLIIDPNNYIPEVWNRMPEIKKLYSQESEHRYVRINSL